MRIFKQFLKQSFALCFFITLLFNYNSVLAESDTHHGSGENVLWPGIYQGFLPCEDCKGIKTSLAFNKNNSYRLITQYVGKSDREIVEKGKFTWGDNDTVILTSNNNSKIRQYTVEQDTLIQLDENGNRISGGDADRYILRKFVIKEPSSQHSGH